MAKILFAWELGGGNGHLAPFYSIARSLLGDGHSLTLAVRDRDRASRLFDGLNVDILQAPRWPQFGPATVKRPISYAQVLFNVGFGEQETCETVLRQWRAIEDGIDPCLIIVDHAPGMMFIARQQRKIVAIGNGFCVPQTGPPIPPFASSHWFCDVDQSLQSVFKTEIDVLQTINRVRLGLQLRELNYLGEVFDKTHASFLTTFAELDHYSDRKDATYRGGLSLDGFQREGIKWPPGVGPRIFAYLKWSRGLGHLFDAIGQSGCPSLIVTDGMNIDELTRIARPHMQFVDQPLPIQQVAKECDFAILNATHGATCSLLLAGKPILQIPLNLEQAITANRTASLGAAVCADKDDGLQMVSALNFLRFDSQYSIAAQTFAASYRTFDTCAAANQIARELCQIVD